MRSDTTEKILNLILEIIHLLIGKDSTIAKKTYGKCVTFSSHHPASSERKKTQKSIIKESLHLSLNEANNNQEILEFTNKITDLLSGEVPIRCQDVTVHFSMEEWEYIEGHKDLYKDVIMVDSVRVARGLQVNKTRTHLRELMLNLTLDFFAEITGEQYLILENDSKTLKSSIRHRISGKRKKKLRSIANTQLHLIYDKNKEQKILDLTNKIIELLTGEVPIRCQDVTVHFSMEEWVYIEEHKDLYKDIMLEDHRPSTSPEKNCPKYATTGKPRRTNVKEKEFSCLICGKSFKQNSKLLRHQIIHTGKKPYTCSECPKSFICKADLTRHQKVHTGEKPFTCPECGKSFSEKYNLIKHQNNHVKETPFKCSRRTKCIDGNIAPHNHQKIHSKDCLVSCSECGKTFKDKSHLLRHHKVHTGERPHLCVECGKSFAHKHHLARHLKIHTGEKPYSCWICGKTYISKSSLVVHQSIHMAENLPQCSECGKIFKNQANLVDHQTIHTGEKMAFCQKCGTAFRTKSELSVHKRSHSKLYSCSCDMSLVNEDELEHHKKITMDKPYSCLECNRSFFTEERLEKHQNVHSGDWPYICSECSKTFCTKGDLTKHHKVHIGVRSYFCSECSKTFGTKSELTKHHRVHTGERPNGCSV